MVGMEVRDGDVGNRLPRDAKRRHAMYGSTAAVEQETHTGRAIAAFHQMRGTHPRGVWGGRAGAHRRELHNRQLVECIIIVP